MVYASGCSDVRILHAPNGPAQEYFEYWNFGKAYFDPAKITVPTLVGGAEWDNVSPPDMRKRCSRLRQANGGRQ
jgi:hypothetical protein